MKSIIHAPALALLAGLGLASSAHAAEILVNADISVSTTWTANNTYNLQQQIYVRDGATLTIEAGTIVASTTNLGGSLAVTRGSQIHVLGTRENPVIMTSKADVATWVGGNPKTGTWREAANEWGNLTLMGYGYVSENIIPGNTAAPNPNNIAPMEGLIADFPGDPDVIYGGGDDDDDSGTISYLSVRYTGRVIGLGNELNGLSLGGIGRNTEINHVEIMNNVDDGIEIWGGTVNVKHFAIWNIGDDSIDVDQGWRGKAQFGLVVQGHSLDAASGSGVCDNIIEADGAEQSDYQPVTTVSLYNLTLIGQPLAGDQGSAWRDNVRLQIRNSIFMDVGRNVVHLDNVDGDGGQGYGFGNPVTLSWADTWTTDWNAVPAHANDFTTGTYASNYPAQTSGKLAEISDSVFFRNLFSTAYDEATARGVFNASNNNVVIPGFDAADAPIKSITRGAPVVKGGRTLLPVIGLDPRPANEALTSVAFAPNDGFFSPVKYRGAFAPGANWADGWTASHAFGFTSPSAELQWVDEGHALLGLNGNPLLDGTGPLTPSSVNSLDLRNGRANAQSMLFVGLAGNPVNFKGGKLVPVPWLLQVALVLPGTGDLSLPFVWPTGIPGGVSLWFQYAIADAAAPEGISLSNALRAIAQ